MNRFIHYVRAAGATLARGLVAAAAGREADEIDFAQRREIEAREDAATARREAAALGDALRRAEAKVARVRLARVADHEDAKRDAAIAPPDPSADIF